MKGHFLMRQEQKSRIDVLESVRKKVMRLKEAAVVLGISYRQCRRIYRRYLYEGECGLIHRLVGRPSNRAIDPGPREGILERYKERYPDFGPTLAAEKLNLDGYKRIDHETLRRWLVKEGLWHKRRKRSGHRTWRQRRAHFGELIQMDGSIHRWFEDRADEDYCLMNMVDDATGVTMSLFDKEETTACAMMLLWEWIECYGIPAALYTDGKNVYVPSEKSNLRAQERGTVVLTQFGRACQKLGIRIITASSPQAKGRVERSNGTYQDRLVKELRLAGISDINSANKLLHGGFIDQLNQKFSVEPRESADFHRTALGYDLESIFCIEQERAITRDWIVRFENNYYQLKRQSKYGPVWGKVLVRKYINSELHFNYRGQDMNYEQLPQRPVPVQRQSEAKKKKKYTPPLDHPWRCSWKKKRRA